MTVTGKQEQYKLNNASLLFLGAGSLYLLLSLLYNEFLIALIDPKPPLSPETAEKIRVTQVRFFSISLVLISVSYLIRRLSWLERLLNKDLVLKFMLSLFAIFLPLSTLENCLRPIADFKPKNTTIFIKDEELGWRLKPNTEDYWGTSSRRVKVKINNKGLRGPELSYNKDPNAFRILYLGDSVTFGYSLENEETFPYLIESFLEERLRREIETVNAGVDGYSQWQEYIYLKKEAIKYNPDLIVLSFVLNDITEKFYLVRFGGQSEGYQLSNSYYSLYDWLKHNSGLVHFIDKLATRLRFGEDIQQGALKEEVITIRSLIHNPDNPKAKHAWNTTLSDLGKIFDYCKERDIPLLLVIFPFTFQFDNIKTLSLPQKIVRQYAMTYEVPVIDLLPILYKKADDLQIRPHHFFLNGHHLSPLGSKIVAEIMADFIQKGYISANKQ